MTGPNVQDRTAQRFIINDEGVVDLADASQGDMLVYPNGNSSKITSIVIGKVRLLSEVGPSMSPAEAWSYDRRLNGYDLNMKGLSSDRMNLKSYTLEPGDDLVDQAIAESLVGLLEEGR
tara:strand:+ start:248 stop:604 length:357 start_codon:yes stop_codon:yes gene_type:complete